MNALSHLFQGISTLSQSGPDQEITQLCFDSRKAQAGSLFFAIPGTQVDGHQFLDQVHAQGCKAWVVQQIPANIPENVTCIQVADSNEALAEISCVFYGHPSKSMQLIGITGTNGKTTSVTLLFELFKSLGHRCGLISTVVNKIQDRIIPATPYHPRCDAFERLIGRNASRWLHARLHGSQFSRGSPKTCSWPSV